MKKAFKFRRLRALLSPNCSEVSFQLTQARLAELPPHRRPFLWVHLLLCRACRCYGKNMVVLDKAFAAYPVHIEQVSPRRLSEESRAKIRAELNNLA